MLASQKPSNPKKRPPTDSDTLRGPNRKAKKAKEEPIVSQTDEKKVVKENGVHKLKRSRPVTRSVEDDSDDDEEEAFDDAEKSTTFDGSSSRESHRAQKTLLSQRRSQKPHASLLSQAKQTWSLLRQKSLSPSKRKEHLQTLSSLLLPQNPSTLKPKDKHSTPQDTNLKDLILNHSFSRIIQTLLKYSSSPQRDLIAQQLQGSYKQLSESRYSRFLVCKILKVASAERRRKILAEYEGSVVRLVRHAEAGKVLADAFEVWAGEWERAMLVREFFGKEVMLFGGFGDGSEEGERERARRGLKGLLGGLDVEKRKRILGATKENLLTIFNNPDKAGGVTHAIVHRALWEYLSAIGDTTIIPSEIEQEKLRREIFESCQEVLAEIVHTKDGSRVVREFLAWGTAKDRKQILKVLKPHIEKMCLDDEAQLVLFTALDVIDDTKLLSKSLVDPIVSCAHTLYADTQGRRSLLYLVVPRSRRHFTPTQIACLEETDSIRARTSKKSSLAREEEVRSAASAGLVGWVEKEGGTVVREASGCLVLAEVMLYAEADKKGAMQTLFKALSLSESEAQLDLIDLPPASRLYKTLLQGGHYNHSTLHVERVSADAWDAMAFAVGFAKEVGREVTVGMCVGKGNGAFVVAELVEALNKGLEGGGEDGKERRREVEEAREMVKGWFGSEVVEGIEKGEAKGKKVLLEKLSSL